LGGLDEIIGSQEREGSCVTRFKELSRIETAIKRKNTAELHWALDYCKMRLGIAARKEQVKHWQKIEKRVRQALDDPA
jgi:putative ubiquitin-RnfH superfamily antitoxin RatB of RatAB toxin-antitoxin module